MSTIEDLPAEILFDIFARLPVKSAFLLRWVCKSFKTLITSSDFIHFHLERNPMKNSSDYLLIRSTEIDCMSRICARTFARDLDIKLPENAVYELGSELTVYGSYNGLLCISARYLCADSPIYLWNPSIRKIRRLPYGLITSTLNDHEYQVTLGMGFHSAGGNDYKVIKFVHHDTDSENTFQVEVYSLNSNSWKRISRVPPVPRDAYFRPKCAYLNGVVYWILSEDLLSIISFDVHNESFRTRSYSRDLFPLMHPNCMQVWNNSLCLFRPKVADYDGKNTSCCEIYILNMVTSKLELSRTLRMESFLSIAWPLGFNTSGSGQDIDMVIRTDSRTPRLVSCTPQGHEIELGMFEYCWYVDVYRESLLLLD